MSEIYRAKEAFAFTDRNGVPRVVTPGSLMSSDDPGYKGRERLFDPVEVAVEKSDARRSGRTETTSADPEQPARSVSTLGRRQAQSKKAEE